MTLFHSEQERDLVPGGLKKLPDGSTEPLAGVAATDRTVLPTGPTIADYGGQLALSSLGNYAVQCAQSQFDVAEQRSAQRRRDAGILF